VAGHVGSAALLGRAGPARGRVGASCGLVGAAWRRKPPPPDHPGHPPADHWQGSTGTHQLAQISDLPIWLKWSKTLWWRGF
jgi:hypothetical protein